MHVHGRMGLGAAVLLAFALGASAQTPAPRFTPYKASGIYAKGETVGWRVDLPAGVECLAYTVKRDGKALLKTGRIEPAHPAMEAASDRPSMLAVEVTLCDDSKIIARLGAAIDPTLIAPTAAAPADFDRFWAGKLAALDTVAFNAKLVPLPHPIVDVEEYTFTLDSLGSQAHGYLAKPKGDGKYPALILYQYAGVYALDPRYAAWRAAQGWLVLNVSAHDLPPDQASGVSEAYPSIGNASRETSYFLSMYLRDCQALKYLASRPDWDGKTLVVMGDSMGGQQSLAVAGLMADTVSAVIVDEPAGADSHGELAERQAGYPFWLASDPEVMRTALYFDTVNFAPRIQAPVLAGVGFIDSAVVPTGVWAAFNRIKAPKEMLPMVDADHMHITPDKVEPFRRRAEQALARLVKGETLFAR